MDNINFGVIFIVGGIIFLFALFLSGLERFKKLFNILSWITAIALVLLAVYYFFLH
jgi:hypothetical protein